MALIHGPDRAVFLDKDGTLVENVAFNVDPSSVRLMPGAEECLRLLQAAGYGLVVVSNQSGLARGYFTEDELQSAWQALRATLRRGGVSLDTLYYCPHLPHGELPLGVSPCMCRKPQPGLLWRAARDLGLDLSRSWLIGDILDDIETGVRAGCRTVLVSPEGRTREELSPGRTPDRVAADLREAAEFILREDAPMKDAVLGAETGRKV